MKKEFQGALQGIKQPLGLHHRAAMLLVALGYIYFALWVLQVLYVASHYMIVALVLILGLVVGGFASRLIRMAVLSPQRDGSGSSPR
jgi:hypothetical protein